MATLHCTNLVAHVQKDDDNCGGFVRSKIQVHSLKAHNSEAAGTSVAANAMACAFAIDERLCTSTKTQARDSGSNTRIMECAFAIDMVVSEGKNSPVGSAEPSLKTVKTDGPKRMLLDFATAIEDRTRRSGPTLVMPVAGQTVWVPVP